MSATRVLFHAIVAGAVFCGAGTATRPAKADTPKPVAGKNIRFPDGYWSGLPQAGSDGKVQQCVMVASRPRVLGSGTVDTALSLTIGHGAGMAFSLMDDKMPLDDILDDEAEVIIDGHNFPAVAFSVTSNSVAIHPGDAAGVLAALAKAKTLRLRSAGDGLDTGAITLDLPGDALAWLIQCGKQFNIAIDRPTDPNAPALPAPRPPSPEIGTNEPTPAGPPSIEDKQKIADWDASELRGSDGRVLVCFIRQHYTLGSGPGPAVAVRFVGTFLMVSRAKGLTMMLKDSAINLPGEPTVQATMAIDSKPFLGFDAHALGNDEIGIFPQHGAALATSLGDGTTINFKAPKVENMEFSIPSGVVPWLRACSHRWGIAFEPEAKPN
jgi:hypothetical protein